MDSNLLWQHTLQAYRAEGVQLVSLEEADAETTLHAIAAEELPSVTATFLRLWKHDSLELKNSPPRRSLRLFVLHVLKT